ncbi:hypothetical protein, partial [Pseudidiomarina halophila]|uniref:hypothetical protein n=1 Tax=Pseudidiomarina halophila TaxID=1449799 RepID=UPI003622C972
QPAQQFLEAVELGLELDLADILAIEKPLQLQQRRVLVIEAGETVVALLMPSCCRYSRCCGSK